jgi:hypothetical protein
MKVENTGKSEVTITAENAKDEVEINSRSTFDIAEKYGVPHGKTLIIRHWEELGKTGQGEYYKPKRYQSQ